MPKKSANKKLTVLVTGGAGFVGSNIASALLKKGHQVVVLDNLSTGSLKALPRKVKFIKGDLRRRADIKKSLKGVDAVIHAAALISVSESFEKPEKYLAVNVGGTSNLLEEMRLAGTKKIIFSSTAAVYDPDGKMPLAETAVKNPYSPYGASKLVVEKLLYYYHLAFGFDVSIFRYFNVYGPGNYQKNPANVVPKFFGLAFRGKPLPIHGNGSMIRDYIYIDDLAAAHLLGLKLTGHQIYNLGSGTGDEVGRLVRLICEVAKSNSLLKFQKIPPGYPARMFADISKIRKELGWKPKISLAQGIKLSASFYKDLYKR